MSPKAEGAAAIAARLQSEADEVLQAAEDILFNADGPNSLTPAQMTVLRAAGMADRDVIESELGRVASVRQHMSAAGTASRFAAAQDRLTAATEQDRLLRPELERTIREAEAKLKTLAAELNSSKMAVDRMRQARDVLQSDRLLPKFARDELAVLEHCSCTDLRVAISNLENRLRVIDGVQALDAGTDGALQYCRNVDNENSNNRLHCPLCEKTEYNDPAGGGTVSYKVIAGALASHKNDLLLEKPSVEADLAKAKVEVARVRSTFSKCRQWYVAQLPD